MAAFPPTLLPPLLTLTSLLPPPPQSPKQLEQEHLNHQPRHILDNLAFLIACGQEAAISCVSKEDQTVIHVACLEEENVVACRAISNVIEEFFRRRNYAVARQKLTSIVLRHNAPYLHWYLTLKFQTSSGLHILRELLQQPEPELTGHDAAEQTANLLFRDSRAHLETITHLVEAALTLTTSSANTILQTYEKLIDSAYLTLNNKPFHTFLTRSPSLEGHKLITWLQKLARFKSASTALLEFMRRDFDNGKCRFGRIAVNGIGVQGASAGGGPGVYRPRDKILGVLVSWVFPPNPHAVTARGMGRRERGLDREREVEEGIRLLVKATGKDKESLKRAVGRYQKKCHPELALVKYHLENPSGRGWRVGKNIGVPGRVCKCCEVFLGEVGGGWKVDAGAKQGNTGRGFVAGWWAPPCEVAGWDEARTAFARDLMEEIRLVLGWEAPAIPMSIPPRALPTPPPRKSLPFTKSDTNKPLPSLPTSSTPPPLSATWPTSPSGLETPPHSASSSDPPSALSFPSQQQQQTSHQSHPPTPPLEQPQLLEAPHIREPPQTSPTQTDFSLAPSSPFDPNPPPLPADRSSLPANPSSSVLPFDPNPPSLQSSMLSLHGPSTSSQPSMASLHGPFTSSQPSMASLHGSPASNQPSFESIFSPTRPTFPVTHFPRKKRTGYLIREPTPQEGAMRDIYEVLEMEDRRFRGMAEAMFEAPPTTESGEYAVYPNRNLVPGRYRDEESRDDLHNDRDRMVITPTSYGGSGFFSVMEEDEHIGDRSFQTVDEEEVEKEREMNITPTTIAGRTEREEKALVREMRLRRERMVETPSDLDLRDGWVEAWVGGHGGGDREERDREREGDEDGDADTVVPSRGGTPKGFAELAVPQIMVQPASSEEPSELSELEPPTTATKTAFDFPEPPKDPPPPPTVEEKTSEETKEELFSPVPRAGVPRRMTMSNIFPEPFSLPSHLKRDIPASAPSPLFASASQASLKAQSDEKKEEKKKIYHHRANSLPVIPMEQTLDTEKEKAQNIKVQKVFSMWAAKKRPVSPLFRVENSDTVSTPVKRVVAETGTEALVAEKEIEKLVPSVMVTDTEVAKDEVVVEKSEESAPDTAITAPPPPPPSNPLTAQPKSFLQSRLQRAAAAFANIPPPEGIDTSAAASAVPAGTSSPRPNRKNRSMSFPTPPEATALSGSFPYPTPPALDADGIRPGPRMSLVSAVNLVRTNTLRASLSRAAPGALEGMPVDLDAGAGPARRKLSIADIARQMKAQQAQLEGRPIRPSFADIARTMQNQQKNGRPKRPSLADIARQMQLQEAGKLAGGARKKPSLADIARQMALKEAAAAKKAAAGGAPAPGGKKPTLLEIARRAKAAQDGTDPAASTTSLSSTVTAPPKQPTLKDLLTPTIATQLSSILSTHSKSISSLRSVSTAASEKPKPPKVTCQLLPLGVQVTPVGKDGTDLVVATAVKGEGVVGAWSSGGVEADDKAESIGGVGVRGKREEVLVLDFGLEGGKVLRVRVEW